MRRRAFTEVELVGVISIIAILAAILFPVFARARAKAQAFTCQNNLFQIGLALRAYAADHQGRYPPREDDLSPLFDRYMALQQPFLCPADSLTPNIPMGAPADPSLLPRPEAGPGGPPSMPGPPAPPAPPGALPAPPPAPVPLIAPQYFPDAGPPLIMTQPGPPSPTPADLGLLQTSYYYRAGRRHNQLPRAPLVSDHQPLHSDRANVLFSDGAIESLTEADWRRWGFQKVDEVRAAQSLPPIGPPGRPKPKPRKGGGDGE